MRRSVSTALSLPSAGHHSHSARRPTALVSLVLGVTGAWPPQCLASLPLGSTFCAKLVLSGGQHYW